MSIQQKILAVMRKVRAIEKGDYNKHGDYEYVGHDAVTDHLRDHQLAEGIFRQPTVENFQVLADGVITMTVKVTYTDVDDGTFVVCEMPAVQPSQTKAKTVTAQQVGQALSYAIKNIELKLFQIVGGGEPDSDSLPIDRDYDERPPARRRQDDRTDQQRDHDRADDNGEVLVRYDDDDKEGFPTASEGAKALADRMKKVSYFFAERMLGMNVEWIQRLPKGWQDRLESIVTAKRKQSEAEGDAMSGRAA